MSEKLEKIIKDKDHKREQQEIFAFYAFFKEKTKEEDENYRLTLIQALTMFIDSREKNKIYKRIRGLKDKLEIKSLNCKKIVKIRDQITSLRKYVKECDAVVLFSTREKNEGIFV